MTAQVTSSFFYRLALLFSLTFFLCCRNSWNIIGDATIILWLFFGILKLEAGVNICPYSCQSLAGTLLKILEFREDFLVARSTTKMSFLKIAIN